MANPKTSMSDDKYKDQNVRFYDKDDHYELIFVDEFNLPTSGKWYPGDKPEYNLLNIIEDLRNADKSKELHIFIGSFGGYVICLNMMMQNILEFSYRVGINMGMADSCGFMMLCCCNEIYTSPWCQFMYHEMFGCAMGKVQEQQNTVKYNEKWWKLLQDHSFIREILTPEELKLGETSEVYLTGQELIDRGKVMSYSQYKSRVSLTKAAPNEFVIVNGNVYRKVGSVYKKYSEDKPCKKNNNNSYSQRDLLYLANSN